MKKLFQKLSRQFSRYSNLSKKVSKELKWNETLPVALFSFVFSLILLSMPFLLIVNLASIMHLRVLWASLIILLITVYPWIYHYTYYFVLNDKYEKVQNLNTNFLILFESTVVSSLLFLLSVMVALMM